MKPAKFSFFAGFASGGLEPFLHLDCKMKCNKAKKVSNGDG